MTSRSLIAAAHRASLPASVFCSLFLSAQAPAQTTDAGQVRIGIVDQSGRSIPKAHAVLQLLPTGPIMEADAQGNGQAVFSGVTTGQYRLTVQAEGFAPAERTLDLKHELAVSVSVQLSISSLSESVDVQADMNSYQPTETVTTSRINVPALQLPEDIQVVSRQLLDEQQIVRVGDVTQTVAGVTRSPGLAQVEDQWSIRGFESIGNLFFKDGFRDNGSILRDTANLEQIEVLKGGAAAEFGRGDPSGVVNLVSKRPLLQPIVALHGQFGSYSNYRFAPDLTGPLVRSRKLLYRYNMALETSDSYRNYVTTSRKYFAPTFLWTPTSTTTITSRSEYLQSYVPYDRGTVAIQNVFGSVPIENFYGQPGTRFDTKYFRTMLAGTQQLHPGWSVEVAGENGFASLKGFGVQIQPNSISADGTTAQRQNTFRNYRDPFWYFRSTLNGDFHVVGLRNQIVAGTDNGSDSVKSGDQNRSSKLTPINLQNPTYNLPLANIDVLTRLIKRSKFASVFGMDFISLPGHFKLMLGGRLDNYKLTSRDTLAVPNTTQTYQDLVPTSRVGLSWLPKNYWTVYASTAQSFNPQLGTDFFGNLFQPERGRQYELGTKFSLPRGRFDATLAGFQIRKSNVLTADSVPSHIGYQVAVGEQQSRGMEVEVNGAILHNWRYNANFAYLQATVQQDTTFLAGAQLINIPRNAGNLWTVYDLPGRGLRGLSLGLGVVSADRRPLLQQTKANPAGTNVFLPAYTRVDLATIYQRNRFGFNAKVENVGNIRYYPSSFGNNVMIVTGTPINFRLGVDFRIVQPR